MQERPNNTVRIHVDVKEGDRAKIRQVNIIGNRTFTENDVRNDFELDTANWLSWFRQDDRYAKESLAGDLEKLRSYYMDRGFADFRVESTQVASKRFLALISISLGALNLLPIPILDGGQIVYQTIEWLKGSPLSMRWQVLGQQAGILALLILMSFAFYNDIARLFG